MTASGVPPERPGGVVTRVTTIEAFDHGRGEAAENVVVLGDGTIGVTLLMTGEVWCSSGGIEKVVPSSSDAVTAGLAADARDRMYVAVRSSAADVAGIWRRDAPGAWNRYAAATPETGLNGITFDADGTLFAADSVNGKILHLPAGTRSLQTWLADERLRPTSPDDPISACGVNGLKFWDGHLYATSTARRTVLRIEIGDRWPPAITDVVSGLVGDDLALDRAGTMYLAVHTDDQVVRIDRHGTPTVLADQADGLDGPTAVAVVDGGLVVTNLGLLGTRHRPSVMRLDTDVDQAALPVPHIA